MPSAAKTRKNCRPYPNCSELDSFLRDEGLSFIVHCGLSETLLFAFIYVTPSARTLSLLSGGSYYTPSCSLATNENDKWQPVTMTEIGRGTRTFNYHSFLLISYFYTICRIWEFLTFATPNGSIKKHNVVDSSPWQYVPLLPPWIQIYTKSISGVNFSLLSHTRLTVQICFYFYQSSCLSRTRSDSRFTRATLQVCFFPIVCA